ncbi:hypothetical protein GQ43DRAFT_496431 [Delitschia confertaspora ATCC 74209]|uniref:Uncharacterized protein n=1 Tax=Delitschia confertaspora ATCC 74209 TaxID=1513339 RepID=A0A9P4JD83_9PLEO|nr:hypothetical protein GQ43DRAFT_496431 [Delitschia confertaspora ATCC 74209]
MSLPLLIVAPFDATVQGKGLEESNGTDTGSWTAESTLYPQSDASQDETEDANDDSFAEGTPTEIEQSTLWRNRKPPRKRSNSPVAHAPIATNSLRAPYTRLQSGDIILSTPSPEEFILSSERQKNDSAFQTQPPTQAVE